MNPVIWWIRRDLRLHDNQALHHALQLGVPIIPLFILDPTFDASSCVGEARRDWLWGALAELETDLRSRNAQLLVRRGAPVTVLAELVAATQAQQIVAEADASPYAVSRDRAIRRNLPLHLVPGVGIQALGAVTKDDGLPYTVYTPYNRRFKAHWRGQWAATSATLLPAPVAIAFPHALPLTSDPLPVARNTSADFPPGEGAARARLLRFIQGDRAPVHAYGLGRDRPDHAGTSQLSPYFRFGQISAREAAILAVQAVERAPTDTARDQAEIWLDALIWREFYQTILMRFPRVREQSFRPEYDHIRWRNEPAEFDAWCAGQTGYPFVDAAMRQLRAIGWMHNRARMAVASFLVKDLLIDWRWGERWFMQQLLDGDPAANNGGWQWAAGTGTDAAPYFRIFNPVSQGTKHDPMGNYVRRWVPELAKLPPGVIHEPWKLTASEQRHLGCVIGRDYPARMVDHSMARERTLAAYKAALGSR